MDLGDPRINSLRIRSALRIMFSVGLVAFAILTGCSHDSESRIRVELRDPPESKPTPQTGSKTYSCPEADPRDTRPKPRNSKEHHVALSWKPSTSSKNGKDIRYCLYRTEGGRVQKNNASSTPPCVHCQLIVGIGSPWPGTAATDDVFGGAEYCYVAVAIDMSNGSLSGFSNEAHAVTPEAPPPHFSCEDPNEKQGDSRNH